MRNLFLIILLSCIISCTKKNDPGVRFPLIPSASGVILPLNIGNQWIYSNTNYDSTGKGIDSSIYTQKVESDTLINNRKWYLLNHQWQTNLTNGLYYFDNGRQNLWYKYPGAAGEKYKIITMLNDTLNFEVININELLTVKAGTFTTYHYRYVFTGLPVNIDLWYAPNIGLIRSDATSMGHHNYLSDNFGNSYCSSNEVLISYKLK
jgi:hypothetical protein